MNSSATDTWFLDNPEFWEKCPGFFTDDERLLEFAEVIGVSAQFIREKRREALRPYLMRMGLRLHNGTIH